MLFSLSWRIAWPRIDIFEDAKRGISSNGDGDKRPCCLASLTVKLWCAVLSIFLLIGLSFDRRSSLALMEMIEPALS